MCVMKDFSDPYGETVSMYVSFKDLCVWAEQGNKNILEMQLLKYCSSNQSPVMESYDQTA